MEQGDESANRCPFGCYFVSDQIVSDQIQRNSFVLRRRIGLSFKDIEGALTESGGHGWMEEGKFRSTATYQIQTMGKRWQAPIATPTSVASYRTSSRTMRSLMHSSPDWGSNDLTEHSKAVDKARTHGMATFFHSSDPTGSWRKDDEWTSWIHIIQKVYFERLWAYDMFAKTLTLDQGRRGVAYIRSFGQYDLHASS